MPSLDWDWIFKAPKRSLAAFRQPHPLQPRAGFPVQGGSHTPASGFWSAGLSRPSFTPGPGLAAVPPSASIEAAATAAAALGAQLLSPKPSETCLPNLAATPPACAPPSLPDSQPTGGVSGGASAAVALAAPVADAAPLTGVAGVSPAAAPAEGGTASGPAGFVAAALAPSPIGDAATPPPLPPLPPLGDTAMQDASPAAKPEHAASPAAAV